MMVRGVWFDNITCPNCRHRHPAHLTCQMALQVKRDNARERGTALFSDFSDEGEGMKFDVQFRIGNRLSTKSRYSLREVCVCLVDPYSLNEAEITNIVTLQEGKQFNNEDMAVTKVE